MGTMKADIVIEEQRNAMQQAYAIAPEMKTRFVKNRRTGNYFNWTPAFHVDSDFEVMPEGFNPDEPKPEGKKASK